MIDIKAASNQRALLNEPVKDNEETLYVINDLSSNLKYIFAAIRSRNTMISFEDLNEHLM